MSECREYPPLADFETRTARMDAHRYFDPLWYFGLMTRKEAYERLAKEMGLSLAKCHISMMDKDQALSVREHAAKIRQEKEKVRC